MPTVRRASLTLVLALLLGGPVLAPAAADTLLLVDGRTLECPTAAKQADGTWKLSFKNGEISLPGALVKEALLAAGGGYEPKDDEEREKLAKGFVRYEGKWISKAELDARLAKRTAEAKKRIEAAKAHREWMHRYKEKTANFEFEYTIPPEIAKGYMELMETYYGVFTKQFGVARPPKEKLKVCFYHDYETFLEVSGADRGTLAYYRFVPPRELNFYYDRLRPQQTVAIMFHEAQHYLSHLMNLKFHIPHNFSEAFAEYYGGSSWDPVKKTMVTGGLQEGRLTEIQTDIARGEKPPLQKLLRNELGYDDYTWGWSFVHFLMETPKYQKKFKQFYMALPNGKDIKRVDFQGDMVTVEKDALFEAFKKYMGVDDLAALEQEWYAHVHKHVTVQSVVGLEEAAFAADSTGRRLRAKRLFKEAVDKGSTNPVLYLRYGERLWGEDDAQAEALFRKGLTFDPLSAELYTALGRLLRARGEAGEAEGKRLIQLAAELDPDSVETWLLVEDALEKVGPPPAPKPGEGGDDGGN